MKTNARFSSKVRLLVGGVLNPMAAPAVTVSIISEEQANQLEYDQKDKVNSGDILNGTGKELRMQLCPNLLVAVQECKLVWVVEALIYYLSISFFMVQVEIWNPKIQQRNCQLNFATSN